MLFTEKKNLCTLDYAIRSCGLFSEYKKKKKTREKMKENKKRKPD